MSLSMADQPNERLDEHLTVFSGHRVQNSADKYHYSICDKLKKIVSQNWDRSVSF